MHHGVIATILLACLLPACKKEEPAPAASPVAASPAVSPAPNQPPLMKQELALDEMSQRIGEFSLAIYYHRPDRRFTGVVLSVPPTDPPAANTGASGVDSFAFRNRQHGGW